jgi:hypothetical protein
MTCNTTELIDKLQRASRNTPGVSSREDIAYALLTVASRYLAGGDADTVRRVMSKLERDAHSGDYRHRDGDAHRVGVIRET